MVLESFLGLGPDLVAWGLGLLVAGTATLIALRGRFRRQSSVTPSRDLPGKSNMPTVSRPDDVSITLSEALSRTREGLWGRIKALVTRSTGLAPDEREELEEILYTSDLGPQTVQRLMAVVDRRLSRNERSDLDVVRQALREEMIQIFASVVEGGDEGGKTAKAEDRESESTGRSQGNGTAISRESSSDLLGLTRAATAPTVVMVVGVNGAGKTTTIGKLAAKYAEAGEKVLIAAGDTFRAAADSQLRVWSERAHVDIFNPEGTKDPSAVAFDACHMAKARGYGVLIVDTAGRLHTQVNLMEELKKMQRVLKKVIPEAPHDVLLVLDANSGQNALVQARQFHEALQVTGVVLTKLDGTAKGGVAIGLVNELRIPIKWIGVGEKVRDLRPFSALDFVDSIVQ